MTCSLQWVTYCGVGLEPFGEALLELAFRDLGGIRFTTAAAEDIIVAATQSPAAC